MEKDDIFILLRTVLGDITYNYLIKEDSSLETLCHDVRDSFEKFFDEQCEKEKVKKK